MTKVERIISGGQTGADQGGLAAAILLGLPCDCLLPKGFKTEDGPMPVMLRALWNAEEDDSPLYPPRTAKNVRLSHGTLIMGHVGSAGTKLTLRLCDAYDRPVIINPSVEEFLKWLDFEDIAILNVAGNRESVNPGLFAKTRDFLVEALTQQQSRG